MLKLIIKSSRNIEIQVINTLCGFFKEFFNQIYIDLNTLLSDYHSIQEHSNRIKIIEFINKLEKRMDFLNVFVKGAFLQKEGMLIVAKGEECNGLGYKLIEIEDFMSGVFYTMKTGFIPKPDILMSIKVLDNFRNIFPKESKLDDLQIANIDDLIDFKLIINHRLMRILLIKENITNYKIENEKLIIGYDPFKFYFILSGSFRNPIWKLNVDFFNENSSIENILIKRMGNSIKNVIEFAKFYNTHNNAQDIFEFLEDEVSGFYKKFSGKIKELEITGVLNRNEFTCIFLYNKIRT